MTELSNDIASLCKFFSQSLSLGVVPTEWKFAKCRSSTKRIQHRYVTTVRSLLFFVQLNGNRCHDHLSPSLYHSQHGFLRERSTVMQLLEVYHNILISVASVKEVCIIGLDLSKAFDKIFTQLVAPTVEQLWYFWFSSLLV